MPATATAATKVAFATADLKKLLERVSGVVSARHPSAALGSVLLDGGVLTASNGTIRVELAIDETTPPVLLPHARLLAILRASCGDEVKLSFGATTCTVRCGKGQWVLPTEDAETFPRWDVAGAVPVCRIPADQFVRAATTAIQAADGKGSKPAFGGVCIDVKDGEVNFVGTDGRRLYRFEVEIDQAVDDRQIVVPVDAMETIVSLADSEDAVQIETNGSEVVFTCGSITVTARLLNATFPKWRQMFEDRDVTPTMLAAAPFLAATRAAAICTSETSSGVTVRLAEDGATLHGKSAEAGEATVRCDIVEFGQPVETMLNPRFLSDWLRTLDSASTVEVEAADGESACVCRCEESWCVVMPLARE